jgi:hypothetical protein
VLPPPPTTACSASRQPMTPARPSSPLTPSIQPGTDTPDPIRISEFRRSFPMTLSSREVGQP